MKRQTAAELKSAMWKEIKAEQDAYMKRYEAFIRGHIEEFDKTSSRKPGRTRTIRAKKA